MTPGERVSLITTIAASLAERTWTDLELTLEAFGFPVSDFWHGDDLLLRGRAHQGRRRREVGRDSRPSLSWRGSVPTCRAGARGGRRRCRGARLLPTVHQP